MDNEKDHIIDPANQQETEAAYHAGVKLTDQASFFHNNKRKLNKSKKS